MVNGQHQFILQKDFHKTSGMDKNTGIYLSLIFKSGNILTGLRIVIGYLKKLAENLK